MQIPKFKWSTRVAFEVVLFTTLLLGAIYLFGLGYSQILRDTSDDVSKTLVTAFFSLLGSVAVVVVGKLVEQKIKVESEIRERKRPVYEEFLKTLFEAGFSGNNGAFTGEQRKVLDNFSHKLILWGSPEMIQAWGDWRKLSELGRAPTVREQQEISNAAEISV